MTTIRVDNTKNKFPGTVSLADAAKMTEELQEVSSLVLSVYQVEGILRRDWKQEIETLEMEYGTGLTVVFKDGSELFVAASGE